MVNLKTIFLGSSLGLYGCSDTYPGYKFDGSLSVDGKSSEHVECSEGFGGLTIAVKKDARRTVYFMDSDKDLRVDELRFTIERGWLERNIDREYDDSDDVGKAILSIAQPEFDRYWNGIKEKNIQEARDTLSTRSYMTELETAEVKEAKAILEVHK